MNPSRISTPVNKKIDEWHFKFLTKTVKFDVFIRRNRDAQDDEERNVKISFEASIDAMALEEAKVDIKQFAPVTLREADINKLRRMCQDHCQKMLSIGWEKVVVVAFNTNEANAKDTWTHGRHLGDRMNAYVDVQFDFVVCLRSGEHFRLEDDEDDQHYWGRNAENILHGISLYGDKPEEVIHVYPFDEKLVATLTILKDRYIELNQQISELVKPKNMPKLVASLERLLPASTNHK